MIALSDETRVILSSHDITLTFLKSEILINIAFNIYKYVTFNIVKNTFQNDFLFKHFTIRNNCFLLFIMNFTWEITFMGKCRLFSFYLNSFSINYNSLFEIYLLIVPKENYSKTMLEKKKETKKYV